MCLAGDLGAIDAKFDVAVSTAAPALDYVVVADTASAQACVELLRARKLGVATFLILDKQAHLAAKCSQAASPPEGDPQLPPLLLIIAHLLLLDLLSVQPLICNLSRQDVIVQGSR